MDFPPGIQMMIQARRVRQVLKYQLSAGRKAHFSAHDKIYMPISFSCFTQESADPPEPGPFCPGTDEHAGLYRVRILTIARARFFVDIACLST